MSINVRPTDVAELKKYFKEVEVSARKPEFAEWLSKIDQLDLLFMNELISSQEYEKSRGYVPKLNNTLDEWLGRIPRTIVLRYSRITRKRADEIPAIRGEDNATAEADEYFAEQYLYEYPITEQLEPDSQYTKPFQFIHIRGEDNQGFQYKCGGKVRPRLNFGVGAILVCNKCLFECNHSWLDFDSENPKYAVYGSHLFVRR